jgi:hypothetical protein
VRRHAGDRRGWRGQKKKPSSVGCHAEEEADRGSSRDEEEDVGHTVALTRDRSYVSVTLTARRVEQL